jgi:3-oxoacyl-[acyl-carrier-protein] synthase II
MTPRSRRVVITGLGLISPLGPTLSDNWNSLINGISGIDFISSLDCSSWKVKVAGELSHFNAACLPAKKKYIKLMNRDAQLAVAATGLALEDAHLNREEIEPSAIGIAFGAFGIQYTFQEAYTFLEALEEKDTVNPLWPLTILPNMSLCNSAIVHNLQGPNISFCSLTASGAQAVGEAFKSIKYGEADLFVAGGCSSLNPSYLFSLDASDLLSREEHDPRAACRPFDEKRNGMVVGEGAAVVMLEELSHAQGRNAPIYGELIGYSSTLQEAVPSPETPAGTISVEGVASCLEETIKQAEVDPQDIDYVNAEGNATPLSDWVETEAIKRVFGDHAYHLSISSTKATMGHLLCASGPADLIAGVLAMRDGIVPPTINYQHPDPRCDLDYTPNHSRSREINTVLSLTLGLSGEHAALLIRKL